MTIIIGLIVLFILFLIFWKPIMAYFTAHYVRKEISTHSKLYKVGLSIVLIPLALIALGLLLGGTDGAVVLVAIVLPFIIPALASGFLVTRIVRGILTKNDKNPSNDTFSTSPSSRPSSSGSPSSTSSYSDVIYVEPSEIEKDPNGSIKDLMWRANNPQPKDYPAVRR